MRDEPFHKSVIYILMSKTLTSISAQFHFKLIDGAVVCLTQKKTKYLFVRKFLTPLFVSYSIQ